MTLFIANNKHDKLIDKYKHWYKHIKLIEMFRTCNQWVQWTGKVNSLDCRSLDGRLRVSHKTFIGRGGGRKYGQLAFIIRLGEIIFSLQKSRNMCQLTTF